MCFQLIKLTKANKSQQTLMSKIRYESFSEVQYQIKPNLDQQNIVTPLNLWVKNLHNIHINSAPYIFKTEETLT